MRHSFDDGDLGRTESTGTPAPSRCRSRAAQDEQAPGKMDFAEADGCPRGAPRAVRDGWTRARPRTVQHDACRAMESSSAGQLDLDPPLARERPSPPHELDPALLSDWHDEGQVPWLEERGIELVRGRGRLAGERRVEVELAGGSTRRARSRGRRSCSRRARAHSSHPSPDCATRALGQPVGDLGKVRSPAPARARRRRDRHRDGAGVPSTRCGRGHRRRRDGRTARAARSRSRARSCALRSRRRASTCGRA